MQSVGEWLGDLGLEQYAAAFEANAISFDQLAELDHQILKDLGVHAAGHRMAILAAATSLEDETQEGDIDELDRLSDQEPSRGAERRQVTVLFADLANYTPIAEKLGEEKTYELIRSVMAPLIQAVESHHGTVQDLAGDGVLALFGAPVAIEDAALWACRAALNMHERVAELARTYEATHDIRLAIRIGLHTGPAIIGEVVQDARGTPRAVGDTVNLAARLQTAAEPGTTLISGATHDIVAGQVDGEAAGARQIKGKADQVQTFRLNGLTAGVSRFGVRADRGLTGLVERESELERLERDWRAAQQGEVRITNVVGEAGIGKSRLIHEFQERVRGLGATFLSGHCAADGQLTPFLPFVEVIRRAYRIGLERDAEVIRRKLRGGLELLGLPVDRHLPYLANLLGVKSVEIEEKGDSETVGIRTRETLQDILREQCRLSPVALFIDDLHWIDSASEAYLLWMAQSNQPMPLLVLCTYRPEYQPPWAERVNVAQVALSRLSDSGTKQMLRQRLGVDTLSANHGDRLVEQTSGNPLWVEEIANYLVESGQVDASGAPVTTTDDGRKTAVPATLESMLMQRVDRLDAAPREVLKAASVIGRRFTADLIGDVAKVPGQIGLHLDALVNHDLLAVEASTHISQLRIKHALIGDVVYGSLLSDEREALHLATARSLEQAYAGREHEIADTLAHHFSHATDATKSVQYLLLAGQESLRIYSTDEAEKTFQQALAIVEANPSAADDATVAELVLATGRVFYVTSQFGETKSLLQLFRPVFERLGNERLMARLLYELGAAHTYACEPADAQQCLEQSIEFAGRSGDDCALAHALAGYANYAAYWQRPAPEVSELIHDYGERAHELGRKAGTSYAAGQGVNALHNYAMFRGDPREQRRQAQRQMQISRDFDDSLGRQIALLELGYIDVLNDAHDVAIDKFDEALRLALTPVVRDYIEAAKGAALAMAGRADEAYELLTRVRGEAIGKGNLLIQMVTDPYIGVAQVLKGEFAGGENWIQHALQKSESNNLHPLAPAICCLSLGEIYMAMAIGGEKVPLSVMIRNAGFLIRTLPFAASKAKACFERGLEYVPESENTSTHAWFQMDLGLLAKAKKRPADARAHLEKARDMAASVDAFAIAEKSEAALKDLT